MGLYPQAEVTLPTTVHVFTILLKIARLHLVKEIILFITIDCADFIYALRESLGLLAEEGVENSWERHQKNAEYLWQGLEDLGMTLHVEKQYRLPTLTIEEEG